MGFRERVARAIAPGLKAESEIREIVQEEVARAKAALPITANYDPNNEGYRRMTGGGQPRRDLTPVTQDRMFEIAYYMYDSSAMMRRMAEMDQDFLFAEPVTVTSGDDMVQEVIDNFWKDPANNMAIDLPNQIMWLGILGEQCWPAEIFPQNGRVHLQYVDPSTIRDVPVSATNVRQAVRVDLLGGGGRPGKTMSIIREDLDPRSSTYGRLVGDCFFFAINRPPNSPRGRSDFLTLFDWIDALERYGYNYLERSEYLLNFVWDVLLKGMDENEIREWVRDNPPPEAGSVRAHNENVEWEAVSPDLKSANMRQGFDMGKSFVMGAAGRPESWFGGGGKAYQTEAEIFGQVPIKNLDRRQQFVKYIVGQVVRFQVDQAVIAGRLKASRAEAGFEVQMPEISKKDLAGMVNGVPQLATALSVAENQGWIDHETAAAIFAIVAGQFGVEITADDRGRTTDDGKDKDDDRVTDDYKEK